jgi:hypothetical protein
MTSLFKCVNYFSNIHHFVIPVTNLTAVHSHVNAVQFSSMYLLKKQQFWGVGGKAF